MGFVSSHTKEGNYLIRFHLSSFVIFWTDLKYSNTVVVCTLTSRHHILSNMQDRLLQLIQIFQYLHHNIEFQFLITNKVVGDDVTLQYWSRLAYSTMGFEFNPYTGLQRHWLFWNTDGLSYSYFLIWRFIQLGKIQVHHFTSRSDSHSIVRLGQDLS